LGPEESDVFQQLGFKPFLEYDKLAKLLASQNLAGLLDKAILKLVSFAFVFQNQIDQLIRFRIIRGIGCEALGQLIQKFPSFFTQFAMVPPETPECLQELQFLIFP
jgi:hypothetical protein